MFFETSRRLVYKRVLSILSILQAQKVQAKKPIEESSCTLLGSLSSTSTGLRHYMLIYEKWASSIEREIHNFIFVSVESGRRAVSPDAQGATEKAGEKGDIKYRSILMLLWYIWKEAEKGHWTTWAVERRLVGRCDPRVWVRKEMDSYCGSCWENGYHRQDFYMFLVCPLLDIGSFISCSTVG